jgi:MFS transporter, ACS family, D-galactonate transporter
MAFCFLGHVNRLSMRVAADERLMAQFSISPTKMGAVYTAFLIAYTLCMTPGGWVIDRWGPKRALIFFGLGSAVLEACTGLGGYGMATGAMALASFLMIRTLLGVANAPLHPGTSRMIPLWIPVSQHGWANGLLQGAAGCGIAGVSIIFGYFIDWFEWRWAFFILGGAMGLLTLVWMVYATDDPKRHPSVNQAESELIKQGSPQLILQNSGSKQEVVTTKSDESDSFRESEQIHHPGKWYSLLRNRSLVLITISYAAVGYFEYLFFYWMNYYFVEILKLDPEVSRFYSSIPPLAMVVGMIGGGWFSDVMVRKIGFQRGRKFVPIVGMAAGAAFLYMGVNVGVKASAAAWVVFWFSLALGSIGATEGPFWSTAVYLGGRRGGTAGGIFNTGGNIGGLLAPVFTPWIAETYDGQEWVEQMFGSSWRMSLYLGSMICFLGVVLWYWIDPAQIEKD